MNLLSYEGEHLITSLKGAGLVRDLNQGPLAPKARIIPLDQQATCNMTHMVSIKTVHLFYSVSAHSCYKVTLEITFNQ